MSMGRQSAASCAAPVPVLVTRPRAEAQAFARALTERLGSRVQPVVAPLMAIRTLSPDLPPGPFAGVIFTSSAGVAAALPFRAMLPDLAWCVGRSTARQAAAAGFQARSADGNAEDLVRLILGERPRGRLLHLRGEDSRGEVAETLRSAGVETLSAIVYRQEARPLSAEALALLRWDGPVLLPLFSPKSAVRMGEALPTDRRAALWLVAMSPAVAEAAPIRSEGVTIAARPTLEAMLQACEETLDRVGLP